MAATRRGTGLAKLSRPRLYEAVPRERLFALLDDQRQHRVMLVAAPPGAGKTTLVASYLESRKLPGIWYQVDGGDAEPSTFFYFLGLAERERPGRGRRPPLPLLTPEYLPDLTGFSRRFFRELFARLEEPATLVFDNFQEADESSPLHAALIAGLEEVPEGVRVFLVSRHPPPDRYARLAANRAMGLIDAILALRAGDEATLRERLQCIFARERGTLDEYGHQLAWCRDWAATLSAEALYRDIAPGIVRRFIRQFDLRAPARDLTAWPWPVRVHALGCFELRVNDELVSFPGKAPKKPLALLKAIICLGGQDVKDYQLVDALWPDDEGDSARDAFRVAMHRLRKILGDADAIVVADGRVSLNPNLCWVDALVFDELTGTARGSTESDVAQTRALGLYRGVLLPADRDEPWTMAMRERLRSKFMHHFARLGAMLEARQAWSEALDLYLRGLDADNLTESFYEGMMRCHAALGRHADALGAYRRLRETLAATLGIEPSPATDALYRSLQRQPSGSGHR